MGKLGGIDRRALLGLAAGVGAAGLVGCSGLGESTACSTKQTGLPADLGRVDDLAVGSAELRGGEGCAQVVVARPAADQVVAFRPICPHGDVLVARDGQDWQCPAHGARFAGLSGALLAGPAVTALPAVEVGIVAGRIVPRSS